MVKRTMRTWSGILLGVILIIPAVSASAVGYSGVERARVPASCDLWTKFQTVSKVNLRAKPTTGSKVIGSVPKGVCLGNKLQQTKHTSAGCEYWLKVTYKGNTGYVAVRGGIDGGWNLGIGC
jgi:hypothetical protein